MPKFKVTDPQSGRSLILTGESPPSEQELTEIFRQHVDQTATQEPQKPPTVIDMARSIPGGLAKGAAAVAGLPGDVKNLADAGAQYVLRKTGLGREARPADPQGVNLPGSADITGAVGDAFGGYYEPQTTAGKYAETIASFAPAAMGPGGMAARAARVIVPGAASEAGGQATQGTPAEPYVRAGGALLGAGAIPLGRTLGRAAGGIANRASEAAFNAPLRDPTNQAREAIRSSIAREGGAAPIDQRLTDWAASGASNPALIDVSGNATRRLVRGAAGAADGNAQNLAQNYSDRIAANLQDNATAHARRLTPNEQRPAGAVSEALADTQVTDARTNYAGPYAEPASVTPEMVSALQGPEGRGAISQAFTAARANRDTQQMGELQDLLNVAREQGGGRDPITGKIRSVETALAELSSGSLDRVRITMRETGASLAARGRRSVATGYRGRVTDIDTALDQTPGLRDARASYRDTQAQRDAVDLGATALNAPSDEYAAQVADLASRSPNARSIAGVGYRQAIVDNIQRPAEGSTGLLNKLSSSTQQTNNLTETYGGRIADRFQAAIGNEASRLRNARFINPNIGSQTEPRLGEQAMVNLASGKVRMWVHIVDGLRSGRLLTAREKEEVVRLATTEGDLRRTIADLPGRNSTAIARQLLISGQLGRSNTSAP